MTEWGVRWEETGEVEPTATRMDAETLADVYPAWGGVVVSRTVTYSEWGEPRRCRALWAHCNAGCIAPCDHPPCPDHGEPT